MGTQARPVIQVKNLYKVYRVGDSHVRALDGVNLEIYKGDFYRAGRKYYYEKRTPKK